MSASDGSTAEYSGGKVNYYEVDIAHPTREGREPYTAECNDIIEALGLSFSEGEAFKAIWRKGAARIKPGKRGHDGGLYDAEKASFYGQRMETIERFMIGRPIADMPADFGQENQLQAIADKIKVAGQAMSGDFKSGGFTGQGCLSSSVSGGPLTRCVGCTDDNCMC
jgi:hypothetical protein